MDNVDEKIVADNVSDNVSDMTYSDLLGSIDPGEPASEDIAISPSVEVSDTDNVLDKTYLDHRGKFRKGNPGRPKREGGDGSSSVEGAGDDTEIDLLSAFYAALRKHGAEKFCRDLLKKSPVVAAQLVSSLEKLSGGSRKSGENINIIVSGGLPIPNVSEGTPDLPVPAPAPDSPDIPTEPAESDCWYCKQCPSQTRNDSSDQVCRICGHLPSGDPPPREVPDASGFACVAVDGGSEPGWTRINSLDDIRNGLK